MIFIQIHYSIQTQWGTTVTTHRSTGWWRERRLLVHHRRFRSVLFRNLSCRQSSSSRSSSYKSTIRPIYTIFFITHFWIFRLISGLPNRCSYRMWYFCRIVGKSIKIYGISGLASIKTAELQSRSQTRSQSMSHTSWNLIQDNLSLCQSPFSNKFIYIHHLIFSRLAIL